MFMKLNREFLFYHIFYKLTLDSSSLLAGIPDRVSSIISISVFSPDVLGTNWLLLFFTPTNALLLDLLRFYWLLTSDDFLLLAIIEVFIKALCKLSLLLETTATTLF